jgi:hypothetical protein
MSCQTLNTRSDSPIGTLATTRRRISLDRTLHRQASDIL